jgi:hypothetical protein
LELRIMKKLLVTAALSVAMGLGTMGAMVATSTSAEAAVVCNRFGDCWRTTARYTYRPAWGLRVYNDNWRWRSADNRRYRWMQARNGRGYYGRNGIWITF